MATYVPNASDFTQPTEDKPVESAALEFRTIKLVLADITTVAGALANIATVADDLNEPVSEIDTVAVNIANVNTVGANIAAVNLVAADMVDINAVAADAVDIGIVAAAGVDIGIVAVNIADVQTVAANIAVVVEAASILNVTPFAQTLLDDTTAAAARSTLGAAASGANSDITSLTGLTTALSVAQGGTGATTAAAAFTAIKQVATDTVTGVVELATEAEVQAGTDTARAITPAMLRSGLNASGAAPIFACRAWVNFDGMRNVTNTGASVVGQPVFIRASGNVTSVTKNGTGDYTVNFTTAMPDANYSVTCAAKPEGTQYLTTASLSSTTSQLAGAVRLITGAYNSVYVDSSLVSAAIFR